MTSHGFGQMRIVLIACMFALGLFSGFCGFDFTTSRLSLARKTRLEQFSAETPKDSVALGWKDGGAISVFLRKRADSGVLTDSERLKLTSCVREWLRTDAETCLNFLTANGAAGLLDEAEIFDILNCPPGATSAFLFHVAGSLSDKGIADAIFSRAFRSELANSPGTCLSLLGAVPKHLQRSLEKEAIREIASKTGAGGLEAALSQFDVSFMAAREGIAMLAASAPDEAFELIEKNRERLNALPRNAGGANQALTWLISVVKPDPDISLRWLREMPPGALVDSWVKEVISLKLQREPEQADQILSNAISDTVRAGALKQAAAVLAGKRPDKAQQLIEKIPSNRIRAEAYSNAGRWMILSNPTGALDMAAAAPDPVGRAQSIEFLTKTWIESDPLKAFEYAAARANDPPFSSVLSYAITERLKPEDPEGSAKRLASLNGLSGEAKQAIRNSILPSLAAPQRDLLSTIMK